LFVTICPETFSNRCVDSARNPVTWNIKMKPEESDNCRSSGLIVVTPKERKKSLLELYLASEYHRITNSIDSTKEIRFKGSNSRWRAQNCTAAVELYSTVTRSVWGGLLQNSFRLTAVTGCWLLWRKRVNWVVSEWQLSAVPDCSTHEDVRRLILLTSSRNLVFPSGWRSWL